METSNTTTGSPAGQMTKEVTMSQFPTTTYAEACAHAEAQHKANPMVAGGDYWVRFDDGEVRLVELRVGESGIARPKR